MGNIDEGELRERGRRREVFRGENGRKEKLMRAEIHTEKGRGETNRHCSYKQEKMSIKQRERNNDIEH